MSRYTSELENEIVRLYTEDPKHTATQIAELLHVDRHGVCRALRRRGIHVRGSWLTADQRADVVKLYTSAIPVKEIADRFGVRATTIQKVLKSNGVEAIRGKLPQASRDAMVEQYQNGAKITDLAAQYGLSRDSVYDTLVRRRIAIRPSRLHKIMPSEHPHIARKYLAGVSTKDLACEYGVAVSNICRILGLEGVEVVSGKLSKARKESAIEEYLAGATSIEVARKYGVGPGAIQSLLKRRGIAARPHTETHRKYTIDAHVFDEIDTEEKSYALGYLYADAYNGRTNNSITLTLHPQDFEILIRFQELFKSNRPIREIQQRRNGRRYVSLQLSSKHLSERLEEVGCGQAKTFTVTFPTWLDPRLHHHFIRGVFDGDGSLSIRTAQYGKRKSTSKLSITGTTALCTSISSLVGQYCDVRSAVRDHWCSIGISEFSVSGNLQVLAVLRWMYKDSTIHLTRKYEKYRALNQLHYDITHRRPAECTICGGRILAKGLCSKHYTIAKRARKDPGYMPRQKHPEQCTTCGEQAVEHGLCRPHYLEWRRMKYAATHPPRVFPTQCSICGAPRFCKGLCNRHYQQERNRQKKGAGQNPNF